MAVTPEIDTEQYNIKLRSADTELIIMKEEKPVVAEKKPAVKPLTIAEELAAFLDNPDFTPLVRSNVIETKNQQNRVLGNPVLGSTLPPREFGGVIKEPRQNRNNRHY